MLHQEQRLTQFLLLNKTLVSKHCFWQLKLVQVLNFRYHIFFTLYYLAISYIILLAFASLFIIRANFINKTQECFDNKPVSIYMKKLEKSIYLSKNIRFLMLKHPEGSYLRLFKIKKEYVRVGGILDIINI